QQMAHMLFDYVVYDLDQRQIVDFRLKPWADRYLVLRIDLDGNEDSMQTGKEKQNRSSLKETTDLCPIRAVSPDAAPLVGTVACALPVPLPLSLPDCSLSSYRAVRSTRNRSAHPFKRKSTMRCLSRSYTTYSNKLRTNP